MPSWALRFPRPGNPPPKPADEHPTDSKLLEGWWRARAEWDIYVKRLRKFEVACAIDMIERREDCGLLEPAEIIAKNLGACWLDGSL